MTFLERMSDYAEQFKATAPGSLDRKAVCHAWGRFMAQHVRETNRQERERERDVHVR